MASSLPLGVNLVGLWLAQHSNWHGGTYGDSGDLSPLSFGKCVDPIPIRGAVYTQQILETFKFENVPPGLTVTKKNSLDFEKESFFAHSLTKTHCSNIINLDSRFGF